MTNSEKPAISDRTRDCMQSIHDTMHWFREKISQCRDEISQDTDALHAYASLEFFPIDLVTSLRNIERCVKHFEKNFSKSQRALGRYMRPTGRGRKNSKDLPAEAIDQLKHINAQFEKIALQIGKSATEIGTVLDNRLDDPTDCLWDYEMDLEASFVLREDDPAYCDDSDNFLTQLNLHMHECDIPGLGWEIMGYEWPDGYEWDPMPHGRIFHELKRHSEGTTKHPPVNLKDILRIGGVWCDLVVRYQFYFDITQGKWIKSFAWTEDERKDNTYVQDAKV